VAETNSSAPVVVSLAVMIGQRSEMVVVRENETPEQVREADSAALCRRIKTALRRRCTQSALSTA
jgi:hypothetical protein